MSTPVKLADPLIEAQAEHDALDRDLTALHAALEKHERDLITARRAGHTPAKLADLGIRAASLRLLVADQTTDVQTAAAALERLRTEREHAERIDELRATSDQLVALRDQYGGTLVAGVLAVVAALEPTRAVRAQWIAARARAREQLAALGMAPRRADEVRRGPDALEALGLSWDAFFSVPDEAAPRVFTPGHSPVHVTMPAQLEDRARALGINARHAADYPHVPASALLSVAGDAVAHSLTEPEPRA